MSNTIEKRIGRYTVRVEQVERGFIYDVLTSGGLLFAAGVDLTSQTAETVLEKLRERYGTRGQA